MQSLVVSTWHRGNFEQQTYDPVQRLALLRLAVAKANAVSQANSRDTGLIKGIFVAPEYSFAAELAGLKDPVSGNVRGRSIHANAHAQLVQELAALSRSYPRLLIIPGSIAWKKTIDEAELERRIRYYFKRQSRHTPRLSGDVLTRALQRTWKRSTANGSFYDVYTLDQNVRNGGTPIPTREISDLELSDLEKSGSAEYATMVMLAEAVVADGGAVYTAAYGTASRFINDTNMNITHMMSNTAYAFLNGKVVFSYHKQGNFHEEVGDAGVVFAPGGRSGIAKIEEYTFGLEVCLDHNIGTLRNQLRPGRALDVQIVISDWVQNSPQNIVAREGGFFVHSSTNSGEAGVWKVQNGGFVWAPGLEASYVGVGWLAHWKMEIDVVDPFELPGFMADMFRRG